MKLTDCAQASAFLRLKNALHCGTIWAPARPRRIAHLVLGMPSMVFVPRVLSSFHLSSQQHGT